MHPSVCRKSRLSNESQTNNESHIERRTNVLFGLQNGSYPVNIILNCAAINSTNSLKKTRILWIRLNRLPSTTKNYKIVY